MAREGYDTAHDSTRDPPVLGGRVTPWHVKDGRATTAAHNRACHTMAREGQACHDSSARPARATRQPSTGVSHHGTRKTGVPRQQRTTARATAAHERRARVTTAAHDRRLACDGGSKLAWSSSSRPRVYVSFFASCAAHHAAPDPSIAERFAPHAPSPEICATGDGGASHTFFDTDCSGTNISNIYGAPHFFYTTARGKNGMQKQHANAPSRRAGARRAGMTCTARSGGRGPVRIRAAARSRATAPRRRSPRASRQPRCGAPGSR